MSSFAFIALRPKDAGADDRCDGGGAEGKVGVHDGAVLGVIEDQVGVEAGPVHPEEQSAQE